MAGSSDRVATGFHGRGAARAAVAAGLVALATACVPSQDRPILTAQRPYDPIITPEPFAPPFEALAELETGGVSGGAPGRAALDIQRALSAMPEADSFLVDGDSIGASPRPWLEFCRNDSRRTRCASEPVKVELTDARIHQLITAQDMVHENTRQRPDSAFVGDRWELIERNQAGDCEDMALTKRDILMTWGWPAGALRPAICTISSESGTGSQLHAVLTVDTDAGTFVLGNLQEGVQSIQSSECEEWVMRSDGIHWSWIEGGSTIPLHPVTARP